MTTVSEIKAAHAADLKIIDDILKDATTRWKIPFSYKMPNALGTELSIPYPPPPVNIQTLETIEDTAETRAEAQAAWDSDLTMINEYLINRGALRFCSGFDTAVDQINSQITGKKLTAVRSRFRPFSPRPTVTA